MAGKEREYQITAEGQVWVTTTVRAKSKAEAMRKAKALHEREWVQASVVAVGLQNHEITNVRPVKDT